MTSIDFYAFLLIVGVYWFIRARSESRYNNYMPKDGYKIDYKKQMLDNVSREELKRKTVAGEYDVPVEKNIKSK